MRAKHFFFDYDGTLTSPETGQVPESARQALAALVSAGHTVALCTGRLQCNAMDLVARSGLPFSTVIGDGGNSATVDGRILWMDPLPLEPVRAFLRRMDEAGIPWSVITDNEMVRYARSEEFVRRSPDYYTPTVVRPDLEPDRLERVFKAFVPCALGEEAGIDFSGVPHVRYNPSTMFIEPIAKGAGIKRLMAHLDAPLEDVVVFGDGMNDLSMFLPEWTSIALGNGRPALKERATYVTSTVDEDGVLRACQEFGWI